MDSPTLRRPAPPPGYSYEADTAPAPAAAAPASIQRPAPPPGFSYDAAAAPAPKLERPGRTALRAAGDLGVGLLEGTVSAGMALPQLANTLTGGAVDRYLFKPATAAVDRLEGGSGVGSTLAEASQDTRDALDTLKSDDLRQREQELANTKGFLPSLKRIITDPTLLAQQVAEQAPQFITPAGATRKAGEIALERAAGAALARGTAKRVAAGMSEDAAREAALPAAERLGRRAALKAGTAAAIGSEAAISAGQNSEQAQQEVMGMDQSVLDANPDYQAMVAQGTTPQAAREALAQQAGRRAALVAGALTAATGGLTGKLESRIFQGEVGHGAPLLTRPGLTELGKATAKEFTQEALQEGGEQFGQNVGVQSVDPNKNLMDQVPEQAALGGVIGGVSGGGMYAGAAALRSRLQHPRFAGATPGSLSDAANTIDANAGPLSRAAAAAPAAPAPAAASASVDQSPALLAAKHEWDSTVRDATAHGVNAVRLAQEIAAKHGVSADELLHTPDVPAKPASATRVDPGAPPWLDPTTGEVQPPTKDQLLQALADHIVRQYGATGDMRISTPAIAQAWGVPKADVDRTRNQAVKVARDQVAAAERDAMQPASASEPAASAPPEAQPSGEPGTTASVPVMITQAMKRELRTLGHTDADIAKMTPQQAHDTLRAGEPLLQPARELAGEQGGSAVDQAVQAQQEQQKAQEGSDETDATRGAEAAAPAGESVQAAGEAVAQPAQDAATGGDRGPGEPAPAVRADMAGAGTDTNAQPALSEQAAAPPDEAPSSTQTTEAPPTSGVSASGATESSKPAGKTAAARDAEGLRVKTPDGEVNGRAHVDQLVAQGYTRVESVRAGDKMVHRLVNAAGESEPIKARQLKYAQEATTRAAPATVRKNQTVATQEQTAAGDTELSRRQVPDHNSMRPAERITSTLYRETNPEGAAELLDGMGRHAGPAQNTVYAASHEHLAQGQGNNRGIVVELDPAGFDGRLNLNKPAARQLISSAGEAELEITPKASAHSSEYIRSVTLKPRWKAGQSAAYANRVLLRLRQLEAKGWVKEKTEAGIVYRPPAQATSKEALQVPAGDEQAESPLPLAEKVEAAAAEAASSPTNDKPEPTEAQKEAGNYAKGHVSIQGLDISIENPRGSTRRGVADNGKPWSHEMSDHYGYIRGTEGADGDHVDVYVGPNPASDQVFVVDQLDQKSGDFDEHKAMLGFDSEAEAVKAYRSNFDKGWKVGPVHGMSMDEFKTWLKDGDTSRPIGEHVAAHELEHNGTRIYPVTIRDSEGKATQRWAVESAGNQRRRAAGERPIGGDSLASTPDEARTIADLEKKQAEQRAAREAEQAAAKAEEDATAQTRRERVKGKSLAEIRAMDRLDEKVKVAGKVVTRRQWLESLIARGEKPSTEQVDKIKPMSRQQFNRASNEEQRAHEKRVIAGGKVTNYYVGDFKVGKIEHDFAQSLLAEATAAAAPTAVAEESDGTTERLFSFAGERARTADRTALGQAQQMEAMGRDSVPDRFGNQPGSPEETHVATGWHRGVDGKWRFEIDDSQATVDADGLRIARQRGQAARLGDVLNHPALLAAYPDLSDVHVRVIPDMRGLGSYSASGNTIEIRPPGDYRPTGDASLKSVLLHEIQHAIQNHEGFARGGSSKEARTLPEFEQTLRQYMAEHNDALPSWTVVQPGPEQLEQKAAHEVYRRLAGEVEARNTQRRANMTAEDRRDSPPSETADVARADQIVRFNGGRADDMRSAGATADQDAHAARVRKVAAQAIIGWKGDDVPALRVVATPEQLPPIAKVDADGRPDDSYLRANGMYDGHAIWIVASAHQIDQAGQRRILTTLAHEGVGHYGIDRIVQRELGADAWKTIEGAFGRLRAEKGAGSAGMRQVLADLERRYGADVSPATYAREGLALMAERGVRNGLLDRAVTALRRWLRKVMPNLKLSEAELRQLLVKSKEYLERGPTYAERVQATQAMSFSRDSWSPEFPDAVLAHPLNAARNHPDYAAAKAGDNAAALRLARDLVTPDFVERVRAALPEGSTPAIVPVVAREAAGNNRIPDAAAEVLAQRLGLTVDRSLVQAEKVGRGGGDAMHRLANQPTFDGAVEPGRQYLLLDDTLTQGGTLAQLKTHIERAGGQVVLATALTGKDYSRKLALDSGTLGKVRERFGSIEGWWRRHFGYGFDGLTQSEARTILTYDKGRLSPDALRDRVLASRIPGLRRVGEAATGEGSGTEAPGTDGELKRDFSLDDRGDRIDPNQPAKPFSRSAQSIHALQEGVPKAQESLLHSAKSWISGKARDFEPKALGALQLRHVLELMEDSKLFPGAKQYAARHQQMDADRQAQIDRGEGLAKQWRDWAYEKGPAGWVGKLKPEAKQLARFIHDVTQLGIDPTDAYKKLLMTDSRGEHMPWTKDLIKERIRALREQMRSRPGDDKTPMMEEIKFLRSLPAREKAREAKYPELVARWNSLPDKAKAIFHMARDRYQELSDLTERALLDRIEALSVPETYKRSLRDRIRFQFEASRVEGVYFPLTRFGDYWVSGSQRDGQPVFGMFESYREAEQAIARLKAAGVEIEAQGLKDTDYRAKNAPSGTFVSDVIGLLQKSGAPEKVQDEVYQMFLKTLPELSMRKHGIHRKNIAGFSDDALRAFAKNNFHSAHQIARLAHGFQMEAALEGMQVAFENQRNTGKLGGNTDQDLAQAVHGDALLGELRKRHDWIMSPKDSQMANVATSVGYLYYMSASPAAALVNLTQGAQVTLPVLGARHGWPKAMRVLGGATKDALRTGGNIQRVLKTDEERQAFKVLEAQGTFQRTATHTLAGIAEGNALTANPAWARVMNVMGWLFHKAEVVNREAAGIAAFRLARGDGQTFEQAVRYADEIVNGTHFDYSNANRARYMQGNVPKILFQFKNYSVGMSWVLYRNLYKAMKGESPEVRRLARRTLTGVLGMTGLFAGVMGLPIINLLRYAANAAHAVGGDDDEPWDFNTEFRSWLAEHLGEDVARWVADGAVSQVTGANVASRVSLSDLWFREPDRELEGRDAYYNYLDAIAGPLGGIAKNMLVGSQMIGQGNVERGVETILPKFIKDAMKATRYASEGSNTLRGDPIVADVSTPQTLLQAIGFQPTKLREQQRINSALMNYQHEVQDRRQTLMNAFAMAQIAGDDDSRSETLERIRAFNAKFPEVAIRMSNLHASLRTRAQRSTEAQNGIFLQKKLAGRIRQEVGAMAGE